MTSLSLVDLGYCRLALPHTSIASIENLSDAQQDHSEQQNYWMLQRGGRRWSLYTLDADLMPRPLLPGEHRIALCLKESPIAISCIHISILPLLATTPLPAMMVKPGSAVMGLLLHQQQVVLQVDPQVIAQRIQSLHMSGPATSCYSEPAISCNAMPGI